MTATKERIIGAVSIMSDIEGFDEYITERFGAAELEKARHGRENAIRLSMVYYPKINRYRDSESLQFEIQYYR